MDDGAFRIACEGASGAAVSAFMTIRMVVSTYTSSNRQLERQNFVARNK